MVFCSAIGYDDGEMGRDMRDGRMVSVSLSRVRGQVWGEKRERGDMGKRDE